MKLYSDAEKIKLVQGLENRGDMNAKDYAKSVGVADVTLYAWRKKLNGKVQAVEAPAGLEFNVIHEREARDLATSQRFGRFMELKESLLSQLRNLRKNQAITFTAPKEKKEIQSVHHACYTAIKKAGLPFGMNYSKSKGLFVIMRREEKA